jgi:hypothetical protein
VTRATVSLRRRVRDEAPSFDSASFGKPFDVDDLRSAVLEMHLSRVHGRSEGASIKQYKQ